MAIGPSAHQEKGTFPVYSAPLFYPKYSTQTHRTPVTEGAGRGLRRGRDCGAGVIEPQLSEVLTVLRLRGQPQGGKSPGLNDNNNTRNNNNK